MLLTISTTRFPATDLGYLLHKHLDKVQTFSTSGGRAHVFYPKATDNLTTASLLPDLDPIDLVRKLPNAEYNALHGMDDGPMRHNDHRFEWSRAEFATWTNRVAGQNQYTVTITGVGEPDYTVGASSQMAVFQK